MGNCIITKFNGSYDRVLPKFGDVIIHAKKLQDVPNYSSVCLQVSANGQTVRVTGDGYFSETYEGLDDPALRLTTITLSDTSLKALYFKNDDYDILISGKYGAIEKISMSVRSGSYPSIFNFDIEEFKYDSALNSFLAYFVQGLTGNVSDLVRSGLTEINIVGTQISGKLTDFSDCVSITTLSLAETLVKDEIMDFVTRQVELERTTCSRITTQNIKNFAVFRGVTLEYASSVNGCMSWDTASKVTIGLGNNTSLSNCPKIYAYGATAEEIAAWEQAGKTVVVVD